MLIAFLENNLNAGWKLFDIPEGISDRIWADMASNRDKDSCLIRRRLLRMHSYAQLPESNRLLQTLPKESEVEKLLAWM